MKNIFYCICLTILFTNCGKETEESALRKDFSGTWQWVRTDGGIAFNIHDTPASTGKNIDLDITSDGKYSVTTNGLLTASGTYDLSTRNCIHDQTGKPFIKFSDPYGYEFMIEKMDNNNLEFSDEASDGIGTLYKRKN